MKTKTLEDGANTHSLGSNLESVQDVMKDLEERKNNRLNLMFGSVADMGFHHAGPPLNPDIDSQFMMRIDGKDLHVANTAIKTACRMIGCSSDHFDQYGDSNALPKALRNIIDDNPGRMFKKVLVRTDGLRVNAILPENYQIKDDYDLVGDFATTMEDVYGKELHGIERIAHDDSSLTSYRMIAGGDMLGKDEAEDSHDVLDIGNSPMFLMFVVTSSEIGLDKTFTTLGTYRLWCQNGALRLDQKQIVARWDHIGSMSQFYSKTNRIIRESGGFQTVCSKVFRELRQIPLGLPSNDLLHHLHDGKFIGRKHYEASVPLMMANNGIRTQFEFFNGLTRSAQGLETIPLRQKGESDALSIALNPTDWGSMLTAGKRKVKKIKVKMI